MLPERIGEIPNPKFLSRIVGAATRAMTKRAESALKTYRDNFAPVLLALLVVLMW